MKTAISIPDDIYTELTRIAEEENVSRSKVVTDATREYLKRRANRRLLSDLDKAYTDDDSTEEKTIRNRSRHYYSRKILKEKW